VETSARFLSTQRHERSRSCLAIAGLFVANDPGSSKMGNNGSRSAPGSLRRCSRGKARNYRQIVIQTRGSPVPSSSALSVSLYLIIYLPLPSHIEDGRFGDLPDPSRQVRPVHFLMARSAPADWNRSRYASKEMAYLFSAAVSISFIHPCPGGAESLIVHCPLIEPTPHLERALA
jgi:hypothetical protein